MPIWIKNLEYSIAASSILDEIDILRLCIPNCEQWITENRVSGDPVAQDIVRHILKIYTRIADWSLLTHDHAASDLRHLVIRLKGLI